MRVLKLTSTASPLSTAAILDIFGKIEGRAHLMRRESVSMLAPQPGDLYFIEGLEGSIPDGAAYQEPPDIFREERFDVIIEKTVANPGTFRFTYYNRTRKYRLVHYIRHEQKKKRAQPPTQADAVGSAFLGTYRFVRDLVLSAPIDNEKTEPLDEIYWARLIRRTLS